MKAGEGWLYLAVYSRRIVGWHVDSRMTSLLVCRALMKAYNLRNPPRGLVVHTDRGSQYTGSRFQALLESYGLRSSMGDVGACWDNAVMERFWGSLKHEWLLIILDGAGYHRSELVKEWAYVMNIELHYLPPYSPNLNPIERLWKVMNEEVRNNRYFASKPDFRAAIFNFFTTTLPEMVGSLSSRLNDNFQMLKNASSS